MSLSLPFGTHFWYPYSRWYWQLLQGPLLHYYTNPNIISIPISIPINGNNTVRDPLLWTECAVSVVAELFLHRATRPRRTATSRTRVGRSVFDSKFSFSVGFIGTDPLLALPANYPGLTRSLAVSPWTLRVPRLMTKSPGWREHCSKNIRLQFQLSTVGN